jgi:hypothetical protein
VAETRISGPPQERVKVGLHADGSVALAVLGRKSTQRAFAYLGPAEARLIADALLRVAELAEERAAARVLS